MPCLTGSGSSLSAIFNAWDPSGTPGQGDNQRYTDMIAQLDIQSMSSWPASVANLRAPRLKDTNTGNVLPMTRHCLGDTIEHDPFDVVCYHDPSIDTRELLGHGGVFTRRLQNGSVHVGQAAVVEAEPMPSDEVGELSMSTLRIQFEGSGVAFAPA